MKRNPKKIGNSEGQRPLPKKERKKRLEGIGNLKVKEKLPLKRHNKAVLRSTRIFLIDTCSYAT